jgi:hypothetical protein
VDWKDVCFCDEFYFGYSPVVTKRIERKRGKEHRYAPENVHRKKVTSKDTKAKTREEDHLELVNVFVVIGYTYRKIIPYKVPNTVGEMSTKVYRGYLASTPGGLPRPGTDSLPGCRLST